MASFLDIAPISETVNVRGMDIEVTGISAKGLAALFVRFPRIQDMFNGKVDEFDLGEILDLGTDAVAAIIAHGCGMGGNKEAEELAATLPLETQLDLLDAIKRATLPGGLGPFVEKIKAMGLLQEQSADLGPKQSSRNTLTQEQLKELLHKEPDANGQFSMI